MQWYDTRHFVWKMLFHAYDCGPAAGILLGCECLAIRTGGYGWSTDGTHWHRSSVAPFNNTAVHLSGDGRSHAAVVAYNTRERPKLLL